MEAGIKQRRSVVKRQKKQAAKLAAKQGAVTAKLKNVPTSTRKMRLVADLVRGKQVIQALSILKFTPKSGAPKIEKLLLSAMSDWQAKNPNTKIEDADLVVKGIFVDGGKILKRLRPAPQGRAHRVRKRSNHVTLVLDSINGGNTIIAENTEVKAESKPKKETKAKSSEEPKAKKTSKKSEK